jgi:hypothetical protein
MIINLFKQRRKKKKGNRWESANICSEKKEKKSKGGSCMPGFGRRKKRKKTNWGENEAKHPPRLPAENIWS